MVDSEVIEHYLWKDDGEARELLKYEMDAREIDGWDVLIEMWERRRCDPSYIYQIWVESMYAEREDGMEKLREKYTGGEDPTDGELYDASLDDFAPLVE